MSGRNGEQVGGAPGTGHSGRVAGRFLFQMRGSNSDATLSPSATPSGSPGRLSRQTRHDLSHNCTLFQKGERRCSLGPTPRTSNVLAALLSPTSSGLFQGNTLYVANSAFF